MRALRTLFALLLIAALAVTAVWLDARQQLSAPMNLAQAQRTDVSRGSSLRGVLAQWQSQGWFQNPRQPVYLRLYARARGSAAAIQAGEYELPPRITPLEALSLLTSGRVKLHSLTIVEGWTFAEMMEAVHESSALRKTLQAEDVMAALGDASLHPEGRFLPETYRFPKDTTDLEFLRRAYTAMQRALEDEWQARAPDLPYDDAYDALTMASIIERETGVPQERGEIAGVFVRRLAMGMKLQTDPTIIYGLGTAFDGNLRRRDLLSDGPYNTYTRPGLPPSPICLPGRAALHAALHPADGDALYFVSRRDGTHQFSASLKAHNEAVRRYQLGKRP